MLCRICERAFAVKPSRTKTGRGKYCSRQCFSADLRGKGTKLTFSQVCEIRESYRPNQRGQQLVKRLAALYGIHPVSMYRITGGQAWRFEK
jgi:hypothetical protein